MSCKVVGQPPRHRALPEAWGPVSVGHLCGAEAMCKSPGDVKVQSQQDQKALLAGTVCKMSSS